LIVIFIITNQYIINKNKETFIQKKLIKTIIDEENTQKPPPTTEENQTNLQKPQQMVPLTTEEKQTNSQKPQQMPTEYTSYNSQLKNYLDGETNPQNLFNSDLNTKTKVELENNIKILNTEKEKLEKDKENLEDQINNLTNKMGEENSKVLKEEIEQLRKQMGELLTQMEKKNENINELNTIIQIIKQEKNKLDKNFKIKIPKSIEIPDEQEISYDKFDSIIKKKILNIIEPEIDNHSNTK
jgi:chromosome segregation ATPase